MGETSLTARLRAPFLALACLTAAAQTVAVQASTCPLPDQHEMLVVQLFFGESIKGRKPLSDKEWRAFLARAVTPRFPDGFTVFDAHGQWMDPRTHAIARERTKVVEIATEDSPVARSRIGEIARLYRERFRQQSVGIITSAGCGVF
jgi:uncharacterized protein DUF3574